MLFGLNLSKIRGKKMLNFEERKALLKKALSEYYADSTVRSILNGTRRPDYENMVKLNKLHKIPFTAWADLPSYLNSTPSKKTMA